MKCFQTNVGMQKCLHRLYSLYTAYMNFWWTDERMWKNNFTLEC